jgi:hypothetical protein
MEAFKSQLLKNKCPNTENYMGNIIICKYTKQKEPEITCKSDSF